MNNVFISGFVQDEPKISSNGQGSARFSLCIGRGKGKNGESLGYDYPNVVAFGSSAEFVSQNVGKGHYVTVMGKLATGSYENKNGDKVYTTDVIAQRIEDATSMAKMVEHRSQRYEQSGYEQDNYDRWA